MINKHPQNEIILEHMKQHGRIDQYTAEDICGTRRLAARIFDLKRGGVPIRTVIRHTEKTRYAEYFLDNA